MKTYPLSVIQFLKTLESLIQENSGLAIIVNTSDSILTLTYNYNNMMFYFVINDFEFKSNRMFYKYSFMPNNPNNFKGNNVEGVPNNILAHLKGWISYCERYNEIQTPFQDPFLKLYQEQFEEEFKIVDEDADTAPFNINKQAKLNGVLDKIVLYLEENKNEETEEEYKEIIEESKDLQKALTTTVKNEVIKKFSKILSKLWKLGIEAAKGALGSALWDGAKFLLG